MDSKSEEIRGNHVEEPEVYDKTSVVSDILEFAKQNWWKALLAVTTAAGTFVLGYMAGGETADDGERDILDVPFEVSQEPEA